MLTSLLSLLFLTEGEDFMPIMRDITFQPQESTTQKVQLEIVRDNITEPTETLRLVVTDVNGQQAPMSINISIIGKPNTSMHNAVQTFSCVTDKK